MKKVFILIAFLFAVVCYAAPPPDLVSDIVTAQSEFVVQDNVNVAVYTFEAQEVAFVNIGDLELATCCAEYFEQVDVMVLPQVKVTDVSYLGLKELNKPPAFYCNVCCSKSKVNKQNSNYGYPFGADYVS